LNFTPDTVVNRVW